MPSPTIEWNGENARQIEHLLREHVATTIKEGDLLRITGPKSLDITLDLGDRLLIEGDRLGVLRKPRHEPDPEVTWTGMNVPEVAKFIGRFQIHHVDLVGRTVFIYAREGDEPLVLKPGDRLIERNGMVIHSKAGKDHRA